MQIGNFVLTITRVADEESNPRAGNKKVAVKRKTVVPDKILSIYSFNDFDEFTEFCTYINDTRLSSKLSKSSLYSLNNKYYLLIQNKNLSIKDFKYLHGAIAEFATYISNADIFERKLTEYGKVVIAKNAVNTCSKYFA